MNTFRLLTADEIECRVAQISEKGLTLLLYKTARTDANILDEKFGPLDWQNDFKIVDGVLYGGIGIKDANDNFVWKWDAGTESNTEAEKGRASDAFKRAGFKWGIGRELYTAPFIWIPSEKCDIKEGNNGKRSCYDSFSVASIEYDSTERIKSLTIMNDKTRQIVFSWRSGEVASMPTEAPKTPQTSVVSASGDFTPECADCHVPISIKEHDYSVKYFKRPLCRDCQRKAARR